MGDGKIHVLPVESYENMIDIGPHEAGPEN